MLKKTRFSKVCKKNCRLVCNFGIRFHVSVSSRYWKTNYSKPVLCDKGFLKSPLQDLQLVYNGRIFSSTFPENLFDRLRWNFIINNENIFQFLSWKFIQVGLSHKKCNSQWCWRLSRYGSSLILVNRCKIRPWNRRKLVTKILDLIKKSKPLYIFKGPELKNPVLRKICSKFRDLSFFINSSEEKNLPISSIFRFLALS